jgi:hypothetical protein
LQHRCWAEILWPIAGETGTAHWLPHTHTEECSVRIVILDLEGGRGGANILTPESVINFGQINDVLQKLRCIMAKEKCWRDVHGR